LYPPSSPFNLPIPIQVRALILSKKKNNSVNSFLKKYHNYTNQNKIYAFILAAFRYLLQILQVAFHSYCSPNVKQE